MLPCIRVHCTASGSERLLDLVLDVCIAYVLRRSRRVADIHALCCPTTRHCKGDMLTSDTLCNATTNCAWDADETACKSSYEANATSPPSNTWGIACSAGKQQAVAGFHSCGLWQYSTSPVSTSEGLTCTCGAACARFHFW